MDCYSMYVDESYRKVSFTQEDDCKTFFNITGVIMDCDMSSYINNELNIYKKNLFNDSSVILHAREISAFIPRTEPNIQERHEIELKRPDYSVFHHHRNVWGYYSQIQNMLTSQSLANMKIISASYNLSDLIRSYSINQAEARIIVFNKIIENYMQFLKKKDATGSILFESSSLRDHYLKHFNRFLAIGSSLFTAKEIRKRELILNFLAKDSGNNCLQFVDPLPNAVLEQYKKNLEISYKIALGIPGIQSTKANEKTNLYRNIKKHFYDGESRKVQLFGNYRWTL